MLMTRIHNITILPDPNGPYKVFRNVELLRNFAVEVKYKNKFLDDINKELMMDKIRKSRYSLRRLDEIETDWNTKEEAEKNYKNFTEYYSVALENLYAEGDKGSVDKTVHFTSDMVDAVVAKTTAQVRERNFEQKIQHHWHQRRWKEEQLKQPQ